MHVEVSRRIRREIVQENFVDKTVTLPVTYARERKWKKLTITREDFQSDGWKILLA